MIVYNFDVFVLFFPGAYPASWNSVDCSVSFLLNAFGLVLSANVILRYKKQLLLTEALLLFNEAMTRCHFVLLPIFFSNP